MIANKNNNFEVFFSTINSLKKLFLSDNIQSANNIKTEIKKQKKEIHKQIDFLINSENNSQLKLLDDKGALIPFDLFFKIVSEKPNLLSSLNIDKYISSYNEELKVESKKIFNYLSNKKRGFYFIAIASKSNDNKEDFIFQKKYINTCVFSNNLVYSNKKEIDEIYVLMLNITKKIQDNDLISSSLGKVSLNFFNKIKELHDKSNIDSINNLAEKVKIISDSSNLNSKIVENILKTTHFSESDLNNNASKLVNEIKLLFLELQKNSLETQDFLKVENLYFKRLPQVISEYIRIPERYKDQLKDNKDSPDKLLIESLNEIKTNLSDIVDNTQVENIKTMKISNKYLKSI